MLTQAVDSKKNETVLNTYDDFGNVKHTSTLTQDGDSSTEKTVNYTYDFMGNLTSSTSGDETSSYTYDNAGRTLLANEKGDCTRTIYDNLGRVIQEIGPEDYDSTKDGLPEENTYSDSAAGHTYVYAANGTLTSEKNRLGTETTYTYDTNGNKVSESFDIYYFEFTPHGDIAIICVNGVEYVSYEYSPDGRFLLLQESYANGHTIRYTYNNNGDVTAQYHNSNANPYVTYTYNDNGDLTEKVNTDTGLKYVYDGDNVSVYKTSDNSLVQSYTETETEADEETGAEAYTTITENHFGTAYTSVSREKSVSYTTGNNTTEYSYQTTGSDEDEKITSDTVKYGDITALSSTYEYDDDGNITNKTTGYNNGETLPTLNEYDDKGRITSSYLNGFSQYYTYDSNGQLVRVDNEYEDYTIAYIYDGRGNITSRKYYDYTRDSIEDATVLATDTFTYANDGWNDKLLSINNLSLTYDEIGNVLTFGNKTFTWENGRNLVNITFGNNNISYTYDENGIRTSKTVNGVTTYFNTKDGVILSQTDGTNTMYFQYDTLGAPLGFIYNGVQYFYITNQMGDVIAITDAQGNKLVEYEYDEWGILLSYISYNGNYDIACKNPLLYRGYYYDNETGYYYLQSRYYDPTICRFINSDIAEISQMSKDIPVGTNLFAYCCNDPINNSDPTGTFTLAQFAKVILGGFFGLILQLISDLLSIAIKIQKGLSTVGSYLSSFFSGAVDTILKKGFYKAVIVAAIGNAIKQITDRIIDKKSVSMKGYAYAVVSTIVKYAINHLFKVKISPVIQKKIINKTPVVIQYIFTYTVGKLSNMKYYDVSIKTLKGVAKKYMSNIFSYVRKQYLGLGW